MKIITHFFSKPDWILHKVFFVFILSLPILYGTLIALFTSNSIHSLNEFQKEVVLLEKVLKNINVEKIKQPTDVDDAYIEKYVENLSFLTEDSRQLSFLCAEVDDKELYSGIKQRLIFLESEQNKLHFTSTKKGDDIVWNTLHPVQMSFLDMQKLVTNVEGKPVGEFKANPNRPNMFFSLLKVTKLEHRSADVFTVDMQINQKRCP